MSRFKIAIGCMLPLVTIISVVLVAKLCVVFLAADNPTRLLYIASILFLVGAIMIMTWSGDKSPSQIDSIIKDLEEKQMAHAEFERQFPYSVKYPSSGTNEKPLPPNVARLHRRPRKFGLPKAYGRLPMAHDVPQLTPEAGSNEGAFDGLINREDPNGKPSA